jgi:hypothetical protein
MPADRRTLTRNMSGPPASSAMKPQPRSLFHIFNFPVAIAFKFSNFSPKPACV